MPATSEEKLLSWARIGKWMQIPSQSLVSSRRDVSLLLYAMENRMLEHKVRAAVVSYFLKAMRIEPNDLMREASVQQIVLLNRKN